MIGQPVNGVDLAVEIGAILPCRGRASAALAQGKDGNPLFPAMLPAGGHAAANHKVPCFEAEEVQPDADPVEALWAVITTVPQCESALVVIEPLEAVLGADRERIKRGELQVVGEAQLDKGRYGTLAIPTDGWLHSRVEPSCWTKQASL